MHLILKLVFELKTFDKNYKFVVAEFLISSTSFIKHYFRTKYMFYEFLNLLVCYFWLVYSYFTSIRIIYS